MAFGSLKTSAQHNNAPASQSDSRTELEIGPELWDATKAVHLANREQAVTEVPDTLALPAERDPTGNLTLATKGQETQNIFGIVEGPPKWRKTMPATSLHALQEWEGYVIGMGKEGFSARLLDITARASIEEEEADIPWSEISEADAKRMKIGSIFRWVIGYERSTRNLSIRRISEIVFRELPAVTRSDERAGLAWAEKIMAAFDK